MGKGKERYLIFLRFKDSVKYDLFPAVFIESYSWRIALEIDLPKDVLKPQNLGV